MLLLQSGAVPLSLSLSLCLSLSLSALLSVLIVSLLSSVSIRPLQPSVLSDKLFIPSSTLLKLLFSTPVSFTSHVLLFPALSFTPLTPTAASLLFSTTVLHPFLFSLHPLSSRLASFCHTITLIFPFHVISPCLVHSSLPTLVSLVIRRKCRFIFASFFFFSLSLLADNLMFGASSCYFSNSTYDKQTLVSSRLCAIVVTFFCHSSGSCIELQSGRSYSEYIWFQI